MNPESPHVVVSRNSTGAPLMIAGPGSMCPCLSECGNARPDPVAPDMRKGRMHEFTLGSSREPGLSQVLTGQVPLSDALRDMQGGGSVKILTSGQIPPNPSELLMRESFSDLLAQLKQEYDLVIVDAPPILAVTDAAVIASTMPSIVTFLVLRAGSHPLAEIEEAVKRMTRNNRKIAGVVFNAFKQAHAKYAGGYSYYQYEYKSDT